MSKGIEVINHDKQQTHWYDNMGQVRDGYHNFDELYEFRLLYNAALFNEWAAQRKYRVRKSWYHAETPYDPIFGGGWFVVMAELPSGQITNHYKGKDWDLFRVPEVGVARAWDGHSSGDVAVRLREFLRLEEKANIEHIRSKREISKKAVPIPAVDLDKDGFGWGPTKVV